MKAEKLSRRRFLKGGGALTGWTVGAIRSASGQSPGPETPEARPKDTRAYGERSRFESSGRTGREVSGGMLTSLQDTLGIITPPALHYVISHGNVSSALVIDPREKAMDDIWWPSCQIQFGLRYSF